MEYNNSYAPFDLEFQTKDLQIMKAMIPYMTPALQRMLAMFVKYQELQKTLVLFDGKAPAIQSCSIEDPQERMTQMLNDIKNYCTKQEKENIDLAINMLQVFSTYEQFFQEQT